MEAIEFHPIRRADFSLLSDWLSTPHVARWWDDDPSPQAIEADYGPVIDGVEPAEVFIAVHGGAAVGLIQRYRFDAYPHYCDELAHILTVPSNAMSIDYFVGPAELLEQGWGTRMIADFVAATWADCRTAACIIVPANAANRGSWRALERAGFRRVGSGDLAPDNPIDNPLHFVYQVDRPAV
jgi:aminoglycoside 6'-N-acetyltransferase